MLKINRQTDYAVPVVLALAKRAEGTRRSTADIQQEMLIPKTLMTRIVAQLSRQGVVDTFPVGTAARCSPPGFANHAKGYVRRAHPAFGMPASQGEADCPFQSSCPERPKWGRVQVAMLREMAAITFQDLVRESFGAPLGMPALV
jgi:DNA-binding IscR family transcriptional regulator